MKEHNHKFMFGKLLDMKSNEDYI